MWGLENAWKDGDRVEHRGWGTNGVLTGQAGHWGFICQVAHASDQVLALGW